MSQNADVKIAEDLVDRREEIEDIKGETKKLSKMLKTGFELKTDGMEKAMKALASGDPKKLAKFYAEIANVLKVLALTDNVEKLNDFLIPYGVDVKATKSMNYLKKGKKKEKFQDLYNEYFLNATPPVAADAALAIIKAGITLNAQINNLEEHLKEESEELGYSCAKRTFKTMTSIISSSRKKDVPIEEVAAEVEVKITTIKLSFR
jgi:hypothetical protein